MEIIALFLGLGVILLTLALPIINFTRLSQTREKLKGLELSLELLRREVRLLKQPVQHAVTPPPLVEAPQKSPSPSPIESPEEKAVSTEIPATTSMNDATPSQVVAEELPEPTPEPPHEADTTAIPPRIPPALRPRLSLKKPTIQWETFVGTKLIMWLGGLLLFLTAGYFLKYSIERDLISPETRALLGFLAGIGLVLGGFGFKRKAYVVASQTFCATGVVILYSVTFACRALYHFSLFTPGITFALMVLITGAAFLLAVRMNALVVAVLGILGGFLTPVLLSTGEDNPLGLFSYLALLNLGLALVSLSRPWGFLMALAAMGTGLTEIGWAERFLNVEKLPVAVATHVGFSALFFVAAEFARRRNNSNRWWTGASAGVAFLALASALFWTTHQKLGPHIGQLGLIALAGDMVLLGLAVRDKTMSWCEPAGGLATYLFLALWMMQHLTEPLIYWVLGAVLIVALLHVGFRVLLLRRQVESGMTLWAHMSSPLALLLLLLPIFKLTTPPLLVWPAIFLINLIAVGFTILTRTLVSLVSVLLITGIVGITWILNIPAEPNEGTTLVLLIGGIAVMFMALVLFAFHKLGVPTARTVGSLPLGGLGAEVSEETLRTQLPALTALMPFLLLILVVGRIPLPNPSPVFALAMALTVLMLTVARRFAQHALTLVALGCVTLLQMVWLQKWMATGSTSSAVSLGWAIAFPTVMLMYPFISRSQCADTSKPWAAAALAFPAHFYLIYKGVSVTWPSLPMGCIPALLSVPMLIATLQTARGFAADHPKRLAILAWMGGSALFFITLIFPIQFDRQWITVSWALEGAALCWMFQRIPHPGVRWTGLGLLGVTLVRLAFNPEVLAYHPRSNTAILNWYLYTYGAAIVSFFAAAHWLKASRDQVGGRSCLPFLRGSATLLLFLLLNLEIADYFTTPGEKSLVFQFTGNSGRDMTYTIAWGVFALGLVSVGIVLKNAGARYAGLALLGITLTKLVFHDLGELPQLYRIGALAAVAVAAIVASILYQKFVASDESSKTQSPDSDP